MSVDVYFDFHTPELYEVHVKDNWSKWYSKLVQLELSGKESYFSERVSHLSNLIIPNNITIWELLKMEHDGQLVDRHLIASIITVWNSLYRECQNSEVVKDCQPQDIFTSGQIKILLKKYKGNHLVFRTD